MPVVSMPDLLGDAVRGGYAVGYFESWDLASLEAVLDAAEAEQSPVIAGFGGMMVDGGWLEARGVHVLGALALAAADVARVPAAVMFNEAQTLAQAHAALDAGFNCLLLSTDALSPTEALQVTADLTARAHTCGVAVEAELGHLPDAAAGEEDGEMTDPAEARAFVAATGVDCLAVSIGNVHIKSDGWATIDPGRLEALHEAVGLPFALHGGTSFPPAAMPHAIANGVAKMNVGTVLKRTYFDAHRGTFAALPSALDVHEALGSRKPGDVTAAARRALTEKVRELMRLYGSSGKAVAR